MKLTERSIKMFIKNQGIDLKESDDELIKNYVECANDIRILRKTLNDEGLILDSTSPRGDVSKAKHPAFDMLSNRLKDLSNLAVHLGLSPKSRKALLQGVETVKKQTFDLNRKVV